MSQIMSVSSMGSFAGGASTSSALGISGGNGPPSGSDGGMAIGSQTTTARLTSVSQSLSVSGSSFSSMSPGDRLAVLVMALIETLFGNKDRDKNSNKVLAGLIGALALSGGGRSLGSGYQSIELQQSSQVLQMTTSTSSSAVQGAAYGRSVSGSSAAAAGSINLVA